MSYPFLSLATVNKYVPLAAKRGVSEVARSSRGFLAQYRRARGQGRSLDPWWANRRENFIKRHMAQVRGHGEALWKPDGTPSRRHLALIMWAYSPQASKLRGRVNPDDGMGEHMTYGHEFDDDDFVPGRDDGPGYGAVEYEVRENPLDVSDAQTEEFRRFKINFIAVMDPLDYLYLTTSSPKHIQQFIDDARPLTQYNEFTAKGLTLYPPFLEVDVHTGKIIAHNGRHRAGALIRAEDYEMKVGFKLVQDDGGYRQFTILDCPPTLTSQYSRKRVRTADVITSVLHTNLQAPNQHPPTIPDMALGEEQTLDLLSRLRRRR